MIIIYNHPWPSLLFPGCLNGRQCWCNGNRGELWSLCWWASLTLKEKDQFEHFVLFCHRSSSLWKPGHGRPLHLWQWKPLSLPRPHRLLLPTAPRICSFWGNYQKHFKSENENDFDLCRSGTQSLMSLVQKLIPPGLLASGIWNIWSYIWCLRVSKKSFWICVDIYNWIFSVGTAYNYSTTPMMLLMSSEDTVIRCRRKRRNLKKLKGSAHRELKTQVFGNHGGTI